MSLMQVTAHLSLPNTGGLAVNQFPVLLHNGVPNVPTPWNVPHVDLDKSPTLDIKKSGWADLHLLHMMSKLEVELLNFRGNSHLKALVDVKQTLRMLLQSHFRAQHPVYIFSRAAAPDILYDMAVIFIPELKLDVALNTFVTDAYILPLDPHHNHFLLPRLVDVLYQGTIIPCNDDETRAWSSLIPACIERCRTWAHKHDCAYLKQGAVLATQEPGGISICECGKGNVSPAFLQRKEWAFLAPFVTRLAISPLFPVTYLNSFREGLEAQRSKNREQHTTPPPQTTARNSCQHVFSGEETVMACSRCKRVRYCGKACQTADWKSHKSTCVKK